MESIKLTKSQEKAIKKQLKKIRPVYFLLILIFLVVGAVAGYITVTQVTKNDKVELIGEKTITYYVSTGTTTYADEGIVAIAFGKDVSKDAKIESNLTKNSSGNYIIDLTSENVYYVKYTIKNIKFGEVVKYRTIIVGANNG